MQKTHPSRRLKSTSRLGFIRILQRTFCALVGSVFFVSLAACGGESAEQKTITKACVAAGTMNAAYCDCFSASLADTLGEDDLKAYAGLMEKVLDAQTGSEEEFQKLLGEAMSSGFDDPNMAMRIGKAAQTATLACKDKR